MTKECYLDPAVAMVIRDSPCDFITLEASECSLHSLQLNIIESYIEYIEIYELLLIIIESYIEFSLNSHMINSSLINVHFEDT